jgi:hypothetical protein
MRGQLAAGAAVALVVCVAMVSHISETSFPPRIPTLSTLTRVTRWGEAPETTMLEPVFPVFTVLVGNPDGTMNCSMPDTCELSLFPQLGSYCSFRESVVPDAPSSESYSYHVAQVCRRYRL